MVPFSGRKRGYDGSNRGGGRRTTIRKTSVVLHTSNLKYAEYGTLKGMGLQVRGGHKREFLHQDTGISHADSITVLAGTPRTTP